MDSATTTGRLPLHHDGGESGQEAVEEEEEEQQQQQQYSLAATSLLGTDPVINGSSRLEGWVADEHQHNRRVEQGGGCGGGGAMGSWTISSAHGVWGRIWLEVRKQCVIAGPMVCTNLLQYSITIVSIIYVGHLGELELSSASIATSFASVTGYTLLLGMGSGLETLCGQAYGAHQYESVGVYLQAAIFCMLLVCIPVAVLWFNMESLLLLMGQDHEISAMAGMYFGWLVPSLFGVAMLHPLLKFLQSQSVVLPMMLCSLFAFLFHIVLCYILIYTLDVGFIGAALATTISYWLNAIFLMLYIKFSVICKKTWRGLSIETFSAVKPFMKLAIPSAFMICLEYWSFELLVLLSGLLPNPKIELSVLSICLNTAALTYMIPFGVSAAVSTRVSNELGAGQPDVAKFSVKIGLGLSSIQALIIASTQLILRNLWGNIFSSSDEVVDYVAKIMPLLAVTSFMDGIQGVLSGVARGCGWQEYAAYANLGAFYCIGMPTAVILAFVFHLNGWGLWLGLACGLFVQMSSLFIMTIHTDWAKQADYAKGRLDNSSLKHLLITSAEPAEGFLVQFLSARKKLDSAESSKATS